MRVKTVKSTHIPQELRKVPQWVSWNADKIPLIVGTDEAASSTNKSTWHPYSELGPDENRGLVITAPYCGVDLDSCRNPETGELDNWAAKLVAYLDSYCEVSPSGTGVHVWVKARLAVDAPHKVGQQTKASGVIEQYDSGRYFTVTGQLTGKRKRVHDRQDQIDDLNIIAKIWKSDGGKGKFLWRRESPNADASGNDYALAAKVIEQGVTDLGRIERIMRLSCLERDKWNKARGDQSYLRYTIGKALKRASNPTPLHVVESAPEPEPQDEPTPIDWEAFVATDHKVADWLAEPILPRGKLTMIYSTGGAGKSLLGLELGAKAALGRAVIDRPESEPLSVVYIDGEMTEADLADRLRSMDVDLVELVNLHYYLLQALPPLDTLEGGAALLEICRAHKAEICIIDPLVYMIEGDENESGPIKNMGRFTTQPLKRDGITLLLMDHSGKDKRQGPRGASAKQNIADVIWKLTAHGDGVRLSSKLPEGKRRQGWIPERIDLARTTGPLTHVHVESDQDDKIEQVMGELESLGVPATLGHQKAGKLLRKDGKGVRQKVIAEAQRRRREPDDDDDLVPDDGY